MKDDNQLLRGLTLALLAMIVVSCSGVSSSAGSPDSGIDHAGITWVGPEGGTVLGPSGALVQIPALALSAPTPIEIRIASADYPPLPGTLTAISSVFAFLPHAITFTLPVKLRVPYAGTDRTTVELYTAPASGSWTKVFGAEAGLDYVQTEVTHFSFFASFAPNRGSEAAGGSSGAGVGSNDGGGLGSSSGGAGGSAGGAGSGGSAPCQPAMKRCSGYFVQECDAVGQWIDSMECPAICKDGACAGLCRPGNRICGGTGVVLECASDGLTYISASYCTAQDNLHTCGAGVCQCPPNVPSPCETCPADRSRPPCPPDSSRDPVDCMCRSAADAGRD